MKGAKPKLDNVVPMRGDQVKPVPEPHNLMSEGARRVWETLAPEMVAQDRLKPHHEQMFAAYCEAVNDVVELSSNIAVEGRTYQVKTRNGMQQKKTANWQARQDALANMRTLGALFGMSPVDDARLSNGVQGDLFDDIMNQLNAPT